MGDREPRPKTKITPRKEKQPGFICDMCKVHIGTVQAYKKHIVQCLESRVYCETCGKTFGKQKFYNQHVNRFHSGKVGTSNARSETKTSAETVGKNDSRSDIEKSPVTQSDPDGSDISDLDKDPEIFLDEETVDPNEGGLVSGDAKDSRNVRDIRTGRMFRKRTAPMPVWAPVKLKPESTSTLTSEKKSTCTSIEVSENNEKKIGNEKREARDTTSVGTGAIRSPDREIQHGEKDTVILENKDRKDCNNNEPKSEVRVGNVGKGKVSSMELLFSVKEAETMVQTVSVSKDGEELFTSTSRNTGPRFGDLKCTFEDLFGPGEANLQEINVETTKGCLKITIDSTR